MKVKMLLVFVLGLVLFVSFKEYEGNSNPNIILVMSDDQGWGQMGYYDHPFLKTPNLVHMAQNMYEAVQKLR